MPTKHAAIYCRISVDPTGRAEGVANQETWGRQYAAEHWPDLPLLVFTDNDISASNGADRPGFNALREAIRDGQVAELWTVEQSRLTRIETTWFELAAELVAAGITMVHTQRDGIVGLDAIGGIRAVLAAEETRKLTARIRDRLAANAAAGQPYGGPPPFGFVRATRADPDNPTKTVKTLAIDEDNADAIRLAARRILDGWSMARAAKAAGWVTASGRPWEPTRVRKALTNPAVVGRLVHQGRSIEGNWEPILDVGTWEALRARLDGSREVTDTRGGKRGVGRRRRTGGRKHILTGGLTVCGRCGAGLGAVANTDRQGLRHISLFCQVGSNHTGCGGTSIRMAPVEQLVINALFDELDRPEFLAEVIGTDPNEQRRHEIVAELDGIERRRNELADLWAAGDLSTPEWSTARGALTGREQDLQAELAERAAPPDIERIRTARTTWDVLNVDERRELLRIFVESITIGPATPGATRFDPNRVAIVWRTT
jgi:DNA invertase Pin-like site-specific DNA recombinase